jgi:hypothetical protein
MYDSGIITVSGIRNKDLRKRLIDEYKRHGMTDYWINRVISEYSLSKNNRKRLRLENSSN